MLLLPFKVILPLLGLNYLFPIFSGLFACIFTVATCFFENNNKLFSFIQLLYTFIIACTLAYFAYAFTQYEFLYLLFAYLPLFAEGCTNGSFVYIPSKLALFIEDNNSPSPPHNIPLPEVSGSSSSSPSPLPLPPASSNSVVPDLSFEQKLLHYRFRSLEDARRLDIAKRIY